MNLVAFPLRRTGVRLGVQLGQGHPVIGGAHDIHQRFILHAGPGDSEHVLRGAVVALGDAVQPVGAAEMGAGAAQLGSPLIHLFQKRGLIPTAQIPGDGAGRIVAAGQKTAVEQVLQRYRFTAEQACCGAVVGPYFIELRLQPGGNGEGRVQGLTALHQKQRGHQLGQAGGSPLLLFVFRIDQSLGVQLIQIHRLSLVRRALGRLPLRGGGRCQSDGQRQQHHRAQKSGFQPSSSLTVEFLPAIIIPA